MAKKLEKEKAPVIEPVIVDEPKVEEPVVAPVEEEALEQTPQYAEGDKPPEAEEKKDEVQVLEPVVLFSREVTVTPTVTKDCYIGKTMYHLEKGKPIKVTRDAERVLREHDRIK